MKLLSFLAAIFFLFYLSSCKEVNTLPISPPVDTTKTQQQQNVLIEDITGVKCVNCPQGNAIVDTLVNNGNGRIEAISFHAGIYAVPYPFSKDTFETAQSVAVFNYVSLNSAGNFPEGCVDRKLYSGQTAILVDRSLWAGLVAQELLDTQKVSISVTNNYNSATRNLNVAVTVTYLTTVTEAQKINVMITESNIIDPQATLVNGLPTIDTFYIHNHVFREALTSPTGDALTGLTNAGSQFTRNYSFTLPANWNSQNCRVVAYVCDNAADINVLQVTGANVQ